MAQLGSRVQHQLRAHTPNDAKALKQTVQTFPNSSYDLAEVLTLLGIGEAVVTVMNPDGAPTPVAWTRMLAPRSLMAPSEAAKMTTMVQSSVLHAKYGTEVDRDSAHEMLARKLQAGAAAAQADAEAAEQAAKQAEYEEMIDEQARVSAKEASRRRAQPSVVDSVVKSSAFKQFARSAGREIARSLFNVARRR